MADPITLGAISAIAGIGGTGMGVAGALQQGKASQAAANYEAGIHRQQGQQELAAATRAANERNLQTDLVQSKQVAGAAASGAGINNPTIADIYGQTAGRGNYLARGDIYQGQERKRAADMLADDALYRGRVAGQAGDLAAIGTGLKGLSKVNWGDFNFG